jgi:hypothetical protein
MSEVGPPARLALDAGERFAPAGPRLQPAGAKSRYEMKSALEIGGHHRQPQQGLPVDCMGGHFTEPNEQKTQQSPGKGRSIALQPSHS